MFIDEGSEQAREHVLSDRCRRSQRQLSGNLPARSPSSRSASETIVAIFLKVDAPHLGGRNQLSTFRAYRIERCLHFFEIDLPRAWHDLGHFNPSPGDAKRGIVGR